MYLFSNTLSLLFAASKSVKLLIDLFVNVVFASIKMQTLLVLLCACFYFF
ncbi:hypothetical protein LguiB_005447 [Lonicera macranthoides]